MCGARGYSRALIERPDTDRAVARNLNRHAAGRDLFGCAKRARHIRLGE
jgi:hypothetical protein